MAELKFIIQAVTHEDHAQALRALLRLRKPTEILVSVAFVKEAGLRAVEETIKRFAARTQFFVGIRNEITSIQAIKRLLKTGARVYAVDTAVRRSIFHPKIYFVAAAKQAAMIIGSANLTRGGLYNNIEASASIKLDLSVDEDRLFAQQVTQTFADLRKNYPRHVFRISSARQAMRLFQSGRLADETVTCAPSTSNRVKKGGRDSLPPMKLKISSQPATATARARIAVRSLGRSSSSNERGLGRLVWESKPLRERDLCIPTGPRTSPTGSMGLKKGAFANIDHRHYFREQVFRGLKWKPDPRPKNWERTTGKVELVVKNLNYGAFELRLSHYTNTRSATYRQNNFMTQIHWGKAKRHVAKRDLLGRILYLYRKNTSPPEFLIEID